MASDKSSVAGGILGDYLTDLGTDAMDDGLHVMALIKGEERYIFVFNDENRTNTLRMLGRYAADPELSFSWYDAAVLSQRIRDAASNPPSPLSSNIPSQRFHWGAAGEPSSPSG